MALHLILGFPSARKDSIPELVYLGRDGDDAQAALDKSNLYRFEIIRNPSVHKRCVKEENLPKPLKAKPAAKAPPAPKPAAKAKPPEKGAKAEEPADEPPPQPSPAKKLPG